MSLPICPQCRSTAISWSDPVPAGSNQCLACGHVAPVARFHDERPLATPLRGRKAALQPVVHRRVAFSRPETRHPQQLAKVQPIEGEHFWWQDQ